MSADSHWARASALLATAANMTRPQGIPIRDPRFWVIQLLILVIDVGHMFLEHVEILLGDSELYLLSVSIFLIPVVYAGLTFGVRGAVPTTLWALVLSLPEVSGHDWATRTGILIQFCIVLSIAILVALRVDRERDAAEESRQANRRLARLNATASAVASSLDLDSVLTDTLRAKLDPARRQIVWIRLLADSPRPVLTNIAASRMDPPTGLDQTQEGLTLAACLTGLSQRTEARTHGAHTAVAALRCEGNVVGVVGVTQPDEDLADEEVQVLAAIAQQLSVALSNIRNHSRTQATLIELSRAKENLDIYVELATEAQEEERKRLSRELHDDILQSLVVARANIESATDADLPETVRSRLIDTQDLLTDTMGNVRRYCKDLRPSLLDDLGLVDATDWLVGDLRKRTALNVDLAIEGPPQRLGNRDELLIFRVIQESLHNVERHAEATHARVVLSFTEDALVTSVMDNGRGMAPTGRPGGHPGEPGLGLRGMDERTKLLRGVITITSQDAKGTTVTLEVPLPDAHVSLTAASDAS